LLSFAFPVFLSSLFYLLMTTAGTVFLGVLSNGANVAAFQAVAPPSRLNYLALTMFAILYVPTVARLRESGKTEEIRSVFTDTTFWLVLLGVPVFAMSTIFAGTFVQTLFGARYADSDAVLVLLACGFYVQAAAGMNDMTLRVLGHLRAAIVADLISLVIGLGVTVVLIIADGALGAATGLLVAVTIRTLIYERTLRRVARISLFERAYFPLHLSVAAVLLVLDGLRLLLHPSVEIDLVLSCAAGLLLLGLFHRRLKLRELMPTRGEAEQPASAKRFSRPSAP
jgi:O-antigen/teichoic acid export membrane protein